MNNQIVTVFGGSGFLGRHIVRVLAREGYTVRVASRTPNRCYELRTAGNVGQVVPQFYDPARPDTMTAAIAGATHVVNCVGILNEGRGRATFHAAHIELTRQIATACKKHHIARLVHISALAVDRMKSDYGRSKMAGEKALRDVFPGVTILRPSVIFGPEDKFFNLFASLARFMPCLPLIGGGGMKFQPVYAGDVAEAVLSSLILPDVGPDDPRGKVYELGGPEILTFRQIYERIFAVTGQRRKLVTMPWALARVKASVMQFFPSPLITPDQLKSLRTDSVVQPGALTFSNLHLEPRGLDAILPLYLSRFRPGGKFGEKQRA